jgi:hypothetical protein
MDERGRERRSRLQTRRFNSNAEADAADRERWPPLTDEERVELAWQLSEDTWPLAGGPSEDERRLRRSVTRVIRG